VSDRRSILLSLDLTFLCLVRLKVSVCDDPSRFTTLNRDDADNGLAPVSLPVPVHPERRAYLNSQQEKVEVEVGKREDIFVGDGHHNRGSTVGKDGKNGIVLPLGRLRCIFRCWRRLWRAESALLLSELHIISFQESFLLLSIRHGARLSGVVGRGSVEDAANMEPGRKEALKVTEGGGVRGLGER
jgi:hypothetical protein